LRVTGELQKRATLSAIGLKLGTEERIERYDPVKLAAISARSFRAVERLSRYKQLTCPEEIRLVERGNEW
jgi:hypothetical protein